MGIFDDDQIAMEQQERPVYFGYDLEFLVGGARINDDGTVTVTFTDPKIIEAIKKNKADNIKGFVTYHTPGFPKIVEE